VEAVTSSLAVLAFLTIIDQKILVAYSQEMHVLLLNA
jgi:hypothetical protein